VKLSATRLHAAIGALYAALGIGLMAFAAHRGEVDSRLQTAALFCFVQGPAILAATALRQGGVGHAITSRLAITSVALGVALFAGDLALKALAATGLFPMSAPLGGVLMIAGWTGFGLSVFWNRNAP
jgi:uncharacterized membrane protein YgdD (TMEM256/DUF423 family)